jgi:hypothetical protein
MGFVGGQKGKPERTDKCNPFTAVGTVGVEPFRSVRRIGTLYVPSRSLADADARLPLPLVGNCLTIKNCPPALRGGTEHACGTFTMKPVEHENFGHSLNPDAVRRPARSARNTRAFDFCFGAAVAILVAFVALAFVLYSIGPKREVEKGIGM